MNEAQTGDNDAPVTVSADGSAYQMVLPDLETDYIQGFIASRQMPYEHALLQDMNSRLSPGAVVIDVGSNIGNHSLYLSVVAGCLVHAFEPDSHLVAALAQSIMLNRLDDAVMVHEVALGSSSSRGVLVTPNHANLGQQHVEVTGSGEIAVVPLDQVEVRRPVAAMKIDVEGMELAVLQGAQGLIEEDRPLLYVECGTDDSFAATSEWLDERGFAYWETYNATPTHLFVPSEGLDPGRLTRRLLMKTARDAIRSTEAITSTRVRLEQANSRYRLVTESQDALRHEQQAAETTLIAVTEELAVARGLQSQAQRLLDDERASHSTRISDLASKLASGQAELGRAKEELDALRGHVQSQLERLEEARQEAAAAAARVAALRAEVRDRAEKAKAAERTIAALTRRAKTAERDRDTALTRSKEAEDSAARHSDDAKQSEFAKDLTSGLLARSQQELREARAGLDQRERELRKVIEAGAAWRFKVEAAEASRRSAETRLEQTARAGHERAGELLALRAEVVRLGEELVTTASQLGAAELRAKELSAGLGSAWLEAGSQATAAYKEREKASWLRDDLDTLHRAHDEEVAQRGLAELRAQQASEQRTATSAMLRDLRSSATYRTGQAVRRSATSLSAALLLPVHLWRIARETSQPEDASEVESSVALPTLDATMAEPGLSPAHTAERANHVAPRVLDATPTGIRVAAIVDDFTRLALSPECQLHHLTRVGWEQELIAAQPHLLFVESAWRGMDGTWHNAVDRFPAELRDILEWCAARGVPTAFWNKEDPVHFSTFLTTARAFDYVFTTDNDCIGRYKSALGHDRVYLLPFACQPRLHHPIEDSPRKDAFSFAGAYYRRYPERTRDLDSFLAHLPRFKPIEIFDRNFDKADENYSFPPAYQRYVVGTLPPERISEAYKGYRFSINLNSVKQSQTMFARRLFELLASNTITVSNFSRGVRLLFGDLVVTTDSGARAAQELEALTRDADSADRLRLAALRSVMSQHTYRDRLDYVMSKATAEPPPEKLPVVVLIGQAASTAQASLLVAQMDRQKGLRWRGLVVMEEGVDRPVLPGITFLRAEAINGMTIGEVVGAIDGCFVAGMDASDYYGPNYVFDLALATRYSHADVFGKRTHYRCDAGVISLHDPGAEYRRAGRLPVRSSIVRASLIGNTTLNEFVSSIEGEVHERGEQVALDRFNYCRSGSTDSTAASRFVDDREMWAGIPLADLQTAAERIPPAGIDDMEQPVISAERLAAWFAGRTHDHINHTQDEEGWHLSSTLAEGAHDYLYAAGPVPVGQLWDGPVARIFVDVTPGLKLQLVFVFLDKAGKRFEKPFFAMAQQNAQAEIPAGTTSVRLGVRLLGPGAATVRGLVLGEVDTSPARIVSTSRHLLVTNHYPSYDDLYRNAFVHSRMKAYLDLGTRTDVFRLRPDHSLHFREFDGVDVITGDRSGLKSLLSTNSYESVAVHFLDSLMWSELQGRDESTRLVVWLHGAEVQSWWRRDFNYTSDAEVRAAKEVSEQRTVFWRDVFESGRRNLHFVFVSRYLAETVMADLDVSLESSRYSIIHNPIDVDYFVYTPKPVEQRLRILSIRPFTAATYANDLTTAAIIELSKAPRFDDYHFRIIGDGPLFDDAYNQLKDFPNVCMERKFLNRSQIAELHQEYGVFLVPTRMDTQGVSRDEAMSSGLVPVTSRVAAVPEFVDDASGILARPDSSEDLARAITDLRDNPGDFLRLSQGAAARVRHQSAMSEIAAKELGLLISTSNTRAPST